MRRIFRKFISGIEQDVKSFGKQLTVDNPVLVKTDNIAILIYSGKTHDMFLEEFDKLTIEGYKLSGISDPRGIPIIGVDMKIGKIFFFQRLSIKL